MWRQLVIPSGLKCHIVRLKPGDALKGSLLEIVRDLDLRSAFILSCVGSVESFTLRYASNADGQCKVCHLSGSQPPTSEFVLSAIP